jgi:hypothetical protein
MNTIRFTVEDELAGGIETFFTERRIEFGDDNIIRASDHSKPAKPSGRFYTAVNTTIKAFSKVLAEYFDSRGVNVELNCDNDTIVFVQKNSPEKIEAFIQKHRNYRFSLKIKP